VNRTLVVVAHADDETLWCGGYLIAHPGTDVLCASIPRNDPQRILDFFDACAVLTANGIVCGKNEAMQDVTAAQVYASTYERIITHNRYGEYGHKLHKKLHHAMLDLKKELLVFGYGIAVGEPIDYERKLRALSCYTTRPRVLANQQRRFDLSRECLLGENE